MKLNRLYLSTVHRIILLIYLTGLCVSCSQWRMQKDIEHLCKGAIHMPADLEIIQNGIVPDSCMQSFPERITLIMYFSSDKCTLCNVTRLANYEKIFDLRKSGQFFPMVIFAPKNQEYKALVADLKLQPQPYPIYIDKNDTFRQLNTNLPKDSRYHTFLLDKNNHVVLVGNPLSSDAMWTLFKSTLDNMIAHDGVYVPE